MKKIKLPAIFRIFLLVVLIGFLGGCASIYVAPEFTLERQKHRLLAIMPFDVTISIKRLPKNVTLEMVKEREADEAYEFQREIYTQFLRRKSRYTIDFQDIDNTNILLSRAGIALEDIKSFTKAEIAEILNVDVILSGTLVTSKPMSEGLAIVATALLGWIGLSGPTNRAEVDVTIHSGSNSALIWNYSHTYSGGLLDSVKSLINALMRKISRKFPYNRK